MPIVFEIAGGRRLKIDEAALAKMLAYRQLAPDATEAGGVLLGRRVAGGHLVVDDASEPLPSDRRTRFTFHRSVEHQAVIDAVHDASDGTCGYLGEWHTHAEPDPRPSDVDLADWRKHAAHDGEALVFVIVGQEVVRAWSCDRAGSVVALERRS